MEFIAPPENILATAISLGLYGNSARRVTSLGQVFIATGGIAANDAWTGGGIYPWMTAATSLEALSDNANDTAAGTGARTIIVNGLAANHKEVAVPVVMDGVTPVALPVQLLRINSIVVATSGTGRRNAGQIIIRDAGGGTIRAYVPIATVSDLTPAMSKQSNYTVPAGHMLLIQNIDLEINNSTGGGTRGVDAMLYFAGPGANSVIRLPRTMTSSDVISKALDPHTPIPVAERNDFQIRCSYTSTANMLISASMEGWLFRRIRGD